MAKRRINPKLTLEQELCSKLTHSTSSRNGRYRELRGFWSLGTRLAQTKIVLPKSIRELRQHPPRVYCSEPYIKIGDEWHNSNRTGLCYVIDLEWKKYMGWLGKDRESVIKEASEWIAIASINLISRHRVATKKGLTRWPDEWKYWEHGTDGYEQYKKENPQGY